MKIVGIPPVWWQFTCRACKAKCLAEPEDVRGRPYTDSDGDHSGEIPVVPCGRCGKERRVPNRLITPFIRELAAKKLVLE